MNKTIFSLIALFLSFSFLTLDYIQLQFTLGYEASWAYYLDIDSFDLLIRYFLILGFYSFIFLTSYFLLEKKITITTLNDNKKNFELSLVNDFSLIVLSIISIYYLYSIINIGFFNYIIEVRAGLTSLGSLYYFSVLALLTSLICSISMKSKNWIFYSSLIIFVILNLASGYRLFIVFLLIYWYIFNYLETKVFINLRITIVSFLILFLLILFQYYRTGGEIGASIIDILNRTAPLSHSFVADLNSTLFYPQFIIFNFFIPHLSIFGTFFEYDFINWNEVIVNESVFRDYLNWRGDPLSRPSGFALNFLIYCYIVAGYTGIIIAALIYVFIMTISFLFLKNNKLWNFGLILMCSVYMGLIDSTIESFVLVQYILIYYCLLICLSSIIKKR